MQTVDDEWVKKLYKSQYPVTKGCLYRDYRLQESDAENLLQDAMVIILKKPQPEIKEVGGYFHRVAINLANKQFSKKRVIIDYKDDEPIDNTILEALEQVEAESCVLKVWEAFKKERPQHAEIIDLIDSDNLNGLQIALYLGKKEPAARQYVYQARKYYLSILYNFCKIHFSNSFWEKRGFNQ
jgi:RNA polymerase sigma factor (sigma-70 family)